MLKIRLLGRWAFFQNRNIFFLLLLFSKYTTLLFILIRYMVYRPFGVLLTNLTYQKYKHFKTKHGNTVRYASIFAKKYGILERYAFFVKARARYVVWMCVLNVLTYRTTQVRYGTKFATRLRRYVPYCDSMMHCYALVNYLWSDFII